MLALERQHLDAQADTPAAAAARKDVRARIPVRERVLCAANRILLGTAYALQPQRLRDVPPLVAWTVLDLLAGRTEIPDPNRTRARPDTFGGVVRRLTPETYLAAARLGFFPWAHCGPLKWWTRERRMVLRLSDLRVSRRVKRLIRKGEYRVTFDTAFADVLAACAAPRDYNWHTLTWITPRFMQLYADLHRLGHAHSFEVWNGEGDLVGGGFGVAFGGLFVGESMFSRETDTSKLGFAVLVAHLKEWGFSAVDGRDPTPVMEKSGFRMIPRAEFEALLEENKTAPDRLGPWQASRDIALQAIAPEAGGPHAHVRRFEKPALREN